jgi:hypothetical protein
VDLFPFFGHAGLRALLTYGVVVPLQCRITLLVKLKNIVSVRMFRDTEGVLDGRTVRSEMRCGKSGDHTVVATT